jgi:hypothetical protein
MADVVLFPYLSLQERVRVGVWELIPKNDLKAQDAVDQFTLELARQHLGLYSLPEADKSVAERCGSFARPAGRPIGEPVDRSTFPALRLSVLGALLSMNPGEDTSNPGMTVSTAENATLYGHPLNAAGRVAVEYGSMMRTLIGGLRAAEAPRFIPHPVELHLPWAGSQLDADLADALCGLLMLSNDDSRRLSTTLEWLDISWRNTDSITSQVRVMALKSGFEVLLGVGEKLEDQRGALSALLDPPGATRRPHTHKNLKGADIEIDVTDLEWWFTTFTFLRNAIAHGREVSDADWQFNGKKQVMAAQERLLEAIRKRAADTTDRRHLLMDPQQRRIHEGMRGGFQGAGRRRSTKEDLDPAT